MVAPSGRARRAVGGLAAVLMALSPAVARAADADEVRAAVDRHLAVYLTVPERREQAERVLVNGDRVEIWFLRPLRRGARQQAACEALRWLLLGRLARAGGVGPLFAALPDIREVTLVFYAVETRVEPDTEGRYRQYRNAAPHLRISITRDKAALLRPEGVDALLRGPACVERGRPLVEVFWTR